MTGTKRIIHPVENVGFGAGCIFWGVVVVEEFQTGMVDGGDFVVRHC